MRHIKLRSRDKINSPAVKKRIIGSIHKEFLQLRDFDNIDRGGSLGDALRIDAIDVGAIVATAEQATLLNETTKWAPEFGEVGLVVPGLLFGVSQFAFQLFQVLLKDLEEISEIKRLWYF